jgi:IS4 transposase
VVTTLTDAEAFTKEDIAELYGFRWNVELDIRAIKQTLGRMALPLFLVSGRGCDLAVGAHRLRHDARALCFSGWRH